MWNWKNNLGLKIMVGIMAILAITDFVTAMCAGKIFEFAETNPIYVWSGSITVIVLITFLWFIAFYWAYTRANPTIRFLFSTVFVWNCIMRFYAIKSNLAARAVMQVAIQQGPAAVDALLQSVQQISSEVKVANYQLNYILPFMIPMLATFVTYLFFMIDHKITKKDILK